MKICINCSKENPDNSGFCAKCGTSLQGVKAYIDNILSDELTKQKTSVDSLKARIVEQASKELQKSLPRNVEESIKNKYKATSKILIGVFTVVTVYSGFNTYNIKNHAAEIKDSAAYVKSEVKNINSYTEALKKGEIDSLLYKLETSQERFEKLTNSINLVKDEYFSMAEKLVQLDIKNQAIIYLKILKSEVENIREEEVLYLLAALYRQKNIVEGNRDPEELKNLISIATELESIDTQRPKVPFIVGLLYSDLNKYGCAATSFKESIQNSADQKYGLKRSYYYYNLATVSYLSYLQEKPRVDMENKSECSLEDIISPGEAHINGNSFINATLIEKVTHVNNISVLSFLAKALSTNPNNVQALRMLFYLLAVIDKVENTLLVVNIDDQDISNYLTNYINLLTKSEPSSGIKHTERDSRILALYYNKMKFFEKAFLEASLYDVDFEDCSEEDKLEFCMNLIEEKFRNTNSLRGLLPIVDDRMFFKNKFNGNSFKPIKNS